MGGFGKAVDVVVFGRAGAVRLGGNVSLADYMARRRVGNGVGGADFRLRCVVLWSSVALGFWESARTAEGMEGRGPAATSDERKWRNRMQQDNNSRNVMLHKMAVRIRRVTR